MKKSRILFALLIGIAVFYSACKKNNSAPPGPALTPSQVASQVALNISGSLFGGIGAVNLSGGLSSAASFAVKTKGKVIQDTNPDCSRLVDTTIAAMTDTLGGGISITLSGSVKFSFGCTNNVLSSYTTNDNVNIKLISPSIDFNYKIGEAFTLTALTPTSSTSNLSMTGTLNSNGSYSLLTGSKGNGTLAFVYNMTSLVIDPNAGDVVSGSATFSTSGTGSRGAWNYQGTIVFNGNHTATVTISGKVYTVNLQTGAVS